jgi:hypothetical protein
MSVVFNVNRPVLVDYSDQLNTAIDKTEKMSTHSGNASVDLDLNDLTLDQLGLLLYPNTDTSSECLGQALCFRHLRSARVHRAVQFGFSVTRQIVEGCGLTSKEKTSEAVRVTKGTSVPNVCAIAGDQLGSRHTIQRAYP